MRWCLLVVALLLGSWPMVSEAQPQETRAKIEALNRKAMEEYDILEFENARELLNTALTELKAAGLEQHPLAARTFLNLATVLGNGIGDLNEATVYMVNALTIDRTLKLDKAYKTPELERVYKEAQSAVAQGGKKPTTPPPAAAPPASPPRETTPAPAAPAPVSDPGPGEGKGTSIESGRSAGGSRWFIGAGAGTSGSYVAGTTEKSNEDIACCVAFELMNLKVEVGYWASPQLVVSFYGRLGLPLDADVAGAPKIAPAGLVRVAHVLKPDRSDGVTLHGDAGVGVVRQSIRLDTPDEDGGTKDTHASGPILIGGGVGWSRSVTPTVRFFVDATAILGIPVVSEIGTTRPQWGLGVDLNLGMTMTL